MSIKTIPEQKIQICDACGSHCPDRADRHHRHKQGTITVTCAAFCYMGDNQGARSRSWDLCDECFGAALGHLRNAKIHSEDPKSGYEP
jgi:hypothetical protein